MRYQDLSPGDQVMMYNTYAKCGGTAGKAVTFMPTRLPGRRQR